MDSVDFDLKPIFLNNHCIPDGFKIQNGIDLNLRYYKGIPYKKCIWNLKLRMKGKKPV